MLGNFIYLSSCRVYINTSDINAVAGWGVYISDTDENTATRLDSIVDAPVQISSPATGASLFVHGCAEGVSKKRLRSHRARHFGAKQSAYPAISAAHIKYYTTLSI